MTTFMAINLGKDMRRQKKEKQALVNERNKLAIEKTEKAMKKLKEEKIELERVFEVGLKVLQSTFLFLSPLNMSPSGANVWLCR